VTLEDLAVIPAEHRALIAVWLIERADAMKPSWLFPEAEARAVRNALAGCAVDLADPLAEDSTIGHAEQVMAELKARR
jgi:hypothetical protein